MASVLQDEIAARVLYRNIPHLIPLIYDIVIALTPSSRVLSKPGAMSLFNPAIR